MGCYNSTVINASADKVWEAFADFHDMSKFSNVIQSCDTVGDVGGTQAGAKRILNGTFHETLLSVDGDARTLSYSIDDGPDAVSKDSVKGYVGKIRLLPVTANGSTFVEWTSTWDSGNGVAELCDPIYQALLSDLAQHMNA